MNGLNQLLGPAICICCPQNETSLGLGRRMTSGDKKKRKTKIPLELVEQLSDPTTTLNITGFKPFVKVSPIERATASAERILSLGKTAASGELLAFEVDLKGSLARLGKQVEGIESAVLKVIVGDDDTTCDDFHVDRGGLTESQAQIFLNEVLTARDIADQRRHEVFLRIVSAVAGGIVGFLLGLVASKL